MYANHTHSIDQEKMAAIDLLVELKVLQPGWRILGLPDEICDNFNGISGFDWDKIFHSNLLNLKYRITMEKFLRIPSKICNFKKNCDLNNNWLMDCTYFNIGHSNLWPKLLFPNLNQQKSASQYHARSAVKASWNRASSNWMKSQLAFHVMRNASSSTETFRQGSTIRTADIWVRLAKKINHFKGMESPRPKGASDAS